MLIKEGSEDQYDAQVQCVGVLINCNTVLTTASCAKHSQGLFLPENIILTRPDCYFMLVELVSLTLGNETGKVGNQIRVGTPSGPSSTVRRTIEKIIIHPAFTTTRKDSNIGLFYFFNFDPNMTVFHFIFYLR